MIFLYINYMIFYFNHECFNIISYLINQIISHIYFIVKSKTKCYEAEHPDPYLQTLEQNY